AGKPTPYLPGPWFNSAKFFDIEYQTYGVVSARPTETETHFFWDGGKNRFATVAYEPDSNLFLGINAFGIRLRHAYFDKALREGWEVGKVVSEIGKANFNPEFYDKWVRR
ncbi:MAG: NAD(P)/FAD-dependent oxidoreductase, partial [Cryomorphaceae bacterium]